MHPLDGKPGCRTDGPDNHRAEKEIRTMNILSARAPMGQLSGVGASSNDAFVRAGDQASGFAGTQDCFQQRDRERDHELETVLGLMRTAAAGYTTAALATTVLSLGGCDPVMTALACGGMGVGLVGSILGVAAILGANYRSSDKALMSSLSAPTTHHSDPSE
jgi:hypothetical protein